MTLSLFDRPGPLADLLDLDAPDTGDPDGLRYYQRERHDACWEKWPTARSLLAVMATGTGKSRFAASLAKRWPERCHEFNLPPTVLWLAHRDELVLQGRNELEAMTGCPVEVEQGDWKASHKAQIVVGSAQTFHARRLEKFPRDRFGLLIPDEFHHWIAPSFKRVLDHFETAKILGLTATPDRSDEIALGQITDDILAPFDITDGIDAGYLVPVRGKHVLLEHVDLDQIKKSKGDLQAGELDEALLASIDGIVQKTLELEPGRKGICFFPGVRTAELAAARFNFYRPGSAAFVSGDTDPLERRRTVRDYKAGRFQFLSNCQVFNEGFDAPETNLIVCGRPTLSRMLYAQMCGRGTRVLPGLVDDLPGAHLAGERRARIAASAKPDMMILDFVGNSSRHSLIGPEDVLGGNYTDVEVKVAKKKREGGDTRDARTLLDEAKRELEQLARAEKMKVKAAVREFDPFNILALDVSDEQRYAYRFGSRDATEMQLAALRNIGVADTELAGLSRSGASRILDQLSKRRKQGLCSYKQLVALRKFGINEANIKFDRANAAITYIASRQWGKLQVDPGQLRAILDHRREAGDE